MSVVVTGSKESKSSQLARILEQRISGGRRLAGYRDIASEFNVSINVVQRAIQDLKKQNLVLVHHGKPLETNYDPAKAPRAMSRFGYIHPYGRYSSFGRSLQILADDAFENVHAIASIRSSEGEPEKERQLAENMLYNGIEGLLLSKCPSELNAEFFRELSEKIPVVLIDMQFRDLSLPAVTFDFEPTGYDIASYMFRRKKASKLLVLMDSFLNESMQDCLGGLLKAAAESGRERDVIIKNMPLQDALHGAAYTDYKKMDEVSKEISQFITENGIDALFCPLNEFITFGISDTQIFTEHQDLKMATFRGKIPFPGINGRKYSEMDLSTWWYDYDNLFSTAVDFFRKKIENGHSPKGVKKIRIFRRSFADVYINTENGDPS